MAQQRTSRLCRLAVEVSRSHSLTHTHTESLTHSHALSHTRSHTQSFTQQHTHTHAQSHTLTQLDTLTHTRTTRSRTPLNEWSVCRRGRCLRNKYKKINVLIGIRPAIPAIGLLQTNALGHTATYCHAIHGLLRFCLSAFSASPYNHFTSKVQHSALCRLSQLFSDEEWDKTGNPSDQQSETKPLYALTVL